LEPKNGYVVATDINALTIFHKAQSAWALYWFVNSNVDRELCNLFWSRKVCYDL
jgi:hypothetical protein